MINKVISRWKNMEKDNRDLIIGVSLMGLSVAGMVLLYKFLNSTLEFKVIGAEELDNGDLVLKFINGTSKVLKPIPE